jgi:hypothetical protein
MGMSSILAFFFLSGAVEIPGPATYEPRRFFKEQIGLSEAQVGMIARGKAVATILPSETPAEIFVFGAVFVNATPEDFIRLATDMDRLRRLPGYLGVGKFSNPPVLSDLDGFTLEPGDIRQLKACRPGNCGMQLPADAMRELQNGVDWSRPRVDAQVNDRVRRMALDILRRYQQEGNGVLGIYRDKEHSFDVDAQLQLLLGRPQRLPTYIPELNRYLLKYPKSASANVDSLFYWEKVNFGLKTTLRLNHAITFESSGERGAARVVVVKQLYASHYFQLALDLTACVMEGGRTTAKGFYLISLRGSTQQGFTGLRGSLLRKLVVSRTRSAQEKALISIKNTLEGKKYMAEAN